MDLSIENRQRLMTPSGRLQPLSAPPAASLEATIPVAMLKLDSPLVQQPGGTPAFPWNQLLINLYRLAQPTGVTPGTAGGITVNAHGQVVSTQASGASIDSPALTGSPTAPTPASNDNSTAIATTAWVQGQGFLTTAADVTQVITVGGDATGSGDENAVITVTVIALRGRSVSAAAPNVGDALVWNGSAWTPTAQNFVPEAPLDGQRYVRQSGTWQVIVSP